MVIDTGKAGAVHQDRELLTGNSPTAASQVCSGPQTSECAAFLQRTHHIYDSSESYLHNFINTASATSTATMLYHRHTQVPKCLGIRERTRIFASPLRYTRV
jgi:hypothetical protein